MFKNYKHSVLAASFVSVALLASAAPVASADLGRAYAPEPVAAASPWSFTFTTYGWVPWMSGNMAIRGREFDVQANPSQILGHLDWSTLPAWMSYAEARNGPIGLFNDIVYANISGSKDFAKALPGQFIGRWRFGRLRTSDRRVRRHLPGLVGPESGVGGLRRSRSFGGRALLAPGSECLWLSLGFGELETERSGSVDWVDPFVGARLRQQIAPGESLVLRADVGGFGVGSDASWQVLATYNWQMCSMGGHLIDGYLGYRALSVDYSQGSGDTRYKYDVLMQGPVMGATMHF